MKIVKIRPFWNVYVYETNITPDLDIFGDCEVWIGEAD